MRLVQIAKPASSTFQVVTIKLFAMAMHTFNTVDEYFSSLSKESKAVLKQVRDAIRQAAPLAEEVISYNIPAIKQGGILVSYAAFKEHVGFYPTPGGISAFKEELSKYKSAKGSVRFPMDKPMPLALIKKMVRYRVAEEKAKGAKKK
jgi:uncharacterized protein YdhG (YjbR/CyaY superfamily)